MNLALRLSISGQYVGSSGGALTFGNVIPIGTHSGQNAPAIRKMGLIGDSRVAGNGGGQFAQLVVSACGEWAWVDPNDFNYGLGGSSIYYAANTAAPAAVADGCGLFVVLTGTNGARKSGEGAGALDTLAERQVQMLDILATLDQVGATIFLCNEMPNSAAPIATIHYDYHLWLNGLTTASASLSNAELVIVNTWDAVKGPGTGANVELATQWANDLLHPEDTGQERMARAVWTAMKANFTTLQVDFGSPDQLLSDGTSTASVNRGTLPSGWSDLTAADDLVYTTSGVGASTIVTLDNSANASNATTNIRITPVAIADAVLLIDYELTADPAPSLVARNWFPKITIRNFDYGTGTPVAATNFWQGDVSSTQQDEELGGRRRMAIRIGASDTSPRIDLLFQLKAGQIVKIYGVDLYEHGGIQIVSGGYLDPALLLVGNQISDAWVPGSYTEYNGNTVSESALDYIVDSASELGTYVLTSGDVVSQVGVTASANYAPDLDYFSGIEGVTDYSFTPTDLEYVVPAGPAPTLSSPVDTANGETAANGSVSTDTDNGTLYWVVTQSSTAPTKAQVKLGQDDTGTAADDAGSQTVSATGVQNLSPAPSGLTVTFTYYIHFMQEDTGAAQSSVVSGDGFTLVDVTAPTLSSPSDAANGSSAATCSVSTNEGNGTLYWVVTTSATSPSAAQVKLGQDHTGSAAADDGSQAVSTAGVQTLSPQPSGLSASTAYYAHFMHEDASTNQSTVSSGDGFTTAGTGPTQQSSGTLINTSAPGTTPAILTSVTMTAGDMLVIVADTCRNTGGSAMALSGTWNGESLTEGVQVLHVGGRITTHILTLVAASSGTFTPVITCSNSAAAAGAYFYVVRGQSGSPVKQTRSGSATSSAGPVQCTIIAPNTGALIYASGSVRFATAGASTMTAQSPLTSDTTFQTGTGNNIDLAFGAGHMTAPSTSDITLGFTPNATQNLLISAIEIF